MATISLRSLQIQVGDNTSQVKMLTTGGLSFNIASRLDNVRHETMDPKGDRSVTPTIEQIGTVSFNFSTYVDMTQTTSGDTLTGQRLLWKSLCSGSSVGNNPGDEIFNFDGDVPSLEELTIYFIFSDENFKLSNCVIDTVEVDLSLGGLTMLHWRGSAQSMTPGTVTPPAITEDYTTFENCLINKSAIITLRRKGTIYNIALIGGNLIFSNNNTYLFKQEIGKLTQVNGHYTGSRIVSGNLDVYLKTGFNESRALITQMLSDIILDHPLEPASTDFSINITGPDTQGYIPQITIDSGTCVFNIPQVEFEETLSLKIPFSTSAPSTVTYSTTT